MNEETKNSIRARLQGIDDDEEIIDVIIDIVFEGMAQGLALRVKTVKIIHLPYILTKHLVRSEWHRPRPIILHGMHTKPLTKPLTEEDPEEEPLLLRVLIDTASSKASRGFEPPRREKKNAHAHTTHTNEKKGIHHPPSYGPL